MDGCHILLSRLWQIDVDVMNEDKENTYKFKQKDKKIIIAPTQRAQKGSKVERKAFVAITNSISEFFSNELLYADDNSGSSYFEVRRNNAEQFKKKIKN